MTDLIVAAQQALNALLMMRDQYGEDACPACDHADAAVYALRAALAEPATVKESLQVEPVKAPVQEPVAWMHTNGVGFVYFRRKPQDKVFNPQPLYTAPPQRLPLTDEALLRQALAYVRWQAFGECRTTGHDAFPPTASELEAALRERLGEKA